MNTIPNVSVIVPAYNAEKFLQRCLNSLAEQTLRDVEVIVVDDGSKDNTGQIADAYAEQDTRFHVIHQENKGVAAARQTGMDAATGEYSIHIDSDDWVDSDFLEVLYTTSKKSNADMVFCDLVIHYVDGAVERRCQRPKSLNSISLMGEMFFDLHGSLCNKLIRLSLLRQYGIGFTQGMNIAEDQFVVLRLLAHGITASYTTETVYHYDHTQNPDSMCNRGVLAQDRLKPLELMAQYTDISPVQDYFDRAVFHIAFEYLYEPRILCPDYPAVFKKHLPSIRRVKGYLFRDKVFVLLRTFGIRLPMNVIKQGWNKLAGRGKS